jgi:regulator of nucleoside diphosphate kinase
MEETMSYEPLRVITELDAARIRDLGSRLPDRGRGLAPLTGLIDMVESEADIVPGTRIDPDVVTLNSTVSFRDIESGTVHRVTVVYPNDMSLGLRRISVLSPVGAALLGQRAGRTAVVKLPDGTQRELRVLEVHYQPEAAGHFAR